VLIVFGVGVGGVWVMVCWRYWRMAVGEWQLLALALALILVFSPQAGIDPVDVLLHTPQPLTLVA
jgi:hypothetical protein